MPISHNLSKKMNRREHFPFILLCQYYFDTKSKIKVIKKIDQSLIHLVTKNLQGNISKLISTVYKKLYSMTKQDLLQQSKAGSTLKINLYNPSYQQSEEEKYIRSFYAEKSFDKIQYLFLVRTLSKLGIKGNFLKLIKSTWGKKKTDSYHLHTLLVKMVKWYSCCGNSFAVFINVNIQLHIVCQVPSWTVFNI